MFRHDFAISKCAPRPAKATQPVSSCHIHHIHRHASGHVFGHVLCHLCRSNSGHVSCQRVHFARSTHRGTARAIRPTQSAKRVHFACSKRAPRHSDSNLTRPKCAEGSRRLLKMCTVPQRERFDPPKVRKGFASRSQNVHRATARAISRSQSDVPATSIYTQAPKYCACHEIRTKSSKAPRLP